MLEFAIAAPILIMLANGILQLGLLFASSAGMKQAVEVGARYATIYVRPEEANIEARVRRIEARVRESGYFIQPSRITEVSVIPPREDDPAFIINMKYSMPLNFIFFQVDPIQLEHERRAYPA